MAHGIRQRSWSLPAKKWGNEEGKDGTACTGGKLHFPM